MDRFCLYAPGWFVRMNPSPPPLSLRKGGRVNRKLKIKVKRLAKYFKGKFKTPDLIMPAFQLGTPFQMCTTRQLVTRQATPHQLCNPHFHQK